MQEVNGKEEDESEASTRLGNCHESPPGKSARSVRQSLAKRDCPASRSLCWLRLLAAGEFLFDSQIQADIGGKAQGIRRANELLLKIDDAEGVARVVLEEVAQLDSPDVRGRPAPSQQAVGGIPGYGTRLLRRVKDGTERDVKNFIRTRLRTRIGGEKFGVLRENVARGNSGTAVAVLALVLEKKNSTGLCGLLVNKRESMIAIAGLQFEVDERVVRELLLPARAGNGEARLLQAGRRQHELACDRAEDHHRSCGIVKGLELSLIKDLADKREIEWRVVDAPSER